jgi:signal transduction histidine kinase/DNA-binding NarL/FixJ family response regulator
MTSPIQRTERWQDEASLSCVILVIENSKSDRAMYRRWLESSPLLNCDIHECEVGEDALQLCESYRPDIVLLNDLLPDLDEIKLLRAFAERLEFMPSVIMLTEEGNAMVAVEAMKIGAKDYLIKGQLTPETLVELVTNALAERNLQLQNKWQQSQRELLTNLALGISRTTELSELMQVAVEGTRVLMDCDRTLIYRFNPDMSGIIVAESVLPEWTAVLGQRMEDRCFADEQSDRMEKYLQGGKMVLSDVETAHLTDCHREMLQQSQVRANLVVPILVHSKLDDSAPNEVHLWGLLIAQHCKKAHEWKMHEQNLMDRISVQMAIAIQQQELIMELKTCLEKQEKTEAQLREYSGNLEESNLRLAEAISLLERRNQELDEFTYIASHDLKAPLRGISNLSQWLIEDLQDQVPAENKQQLDRIQGQALRMDELINGLLEYSRVGKENIALKLVDLSQLLQEVIDFLAVPPGLRIQFSNNLPHITTIEVLLKQVLSNLVGNSVKYHDKIDGNIEILVQDRESFLEFTVTDNGPGIEPKHHQRIFGIFQTLATANEQKGTGIGLTIVKKIVEGQGGSIWVESQLGRGSAFSFTWPKQHPLSKTELAKVKQEQVFG